MHLETTKSIHLKIIHHCQMQITDGGISMEKFIYDKNNGLWYELHGDYYLPCLVVTPKEKQTIGVWGRKHLQYLKEHRPMLYSELTLSGRLHGYLAAVDDQARKRLSRLITQMANAEGINEQMKEHDQMTWVRAMNNIRNRAEEVILSDLIYGEVAI